MVQFNLQCTFILTPLSKCDKSLSDRQDTYLFVHLDIRSTYSFSPLPWTQYGALEPSTLSLTDLGKVASKVRGENELWLAAALTQPALCLLEPEHLAATVAALLCPETLNRSSVWCKYSSSPEVEEAIFQIEPARQRLQMVQVRHSFAQPP